MEIGPNCLLKNYRKWLITDYTHFRFVPVKATFMVQNSSVAIHETLLIVPTLFPAVAEAVHLVNSSLETEEPSALLEQLLSHYSGLENIQAHEALQYRNVMRALKAAKAEVGSNKEHT